ncbi:DNA-directed RNA polymerase subunit N [Candidatus Altiarchaeota archaeon]
MIIPVRCFTCGKPISQDWEEYAERRKGGDKPKDILNDLRYERYCCRRMFLSHSDVIDEILVYKRF